MTASAGSGGSDFERWLDEELKRAFGQVTGPRSRSAQAAYRATPQPQKLSLRFAVKSGVAAALTSKAAASGVVIALAAGGGSAAVATAATGSANPVDWAPAVVQVVQDCADDVRGTANVTGGTSVGQCVSAVARQRAQVKPVRPASQARTNAPEASPGGMAARPEDLSRSAPGAASAPRQEAGQLSPSTGGSPGSLPSAQPSPSPSPSPTPGTTPTPDADPTRAGG